MHLLTLKRLTFYEPLVNVTFKFYVISLKVTLTKGS